MNNIGLYIHVPFCRRKCAYCDFYSLAGAESLIDDYAAAAVRNIKAIGRSCDTVYFGGGTPSLLSPHHIYDMLVTADLAENAEISAECNPDSADYEKLCGFKAAGINRISVGIQTLCDREIESIGRLHNSEQAITAIKNARKAGFENISADLMLGLPYQTEATVRENITRLCGLGVTHISAYMLIIEEGTPLADNIELINAAADDDMSADFYEMAVDALAEYGLRRYEISNFAAEGFECRHNLKYWRCEDYIGVGPSAHSCEGGKRYAVEKDLNSFISSPLQHTVITDDAPCTLDERIMLALRLAEGFDLSLAGEYAHKLIDAARPLERHSLLTVQNNRIALTEKGFPVSNEIICKLTDALI